MLHEIRDRAMDLERRNGTPFDLAVYDVLEHYEKRQEFIDLAADALTKKKPRRRKKKRNFYTVDGYVVRNILQGGAPGMGRR